MAATLVDQHLHQDAIVDTTLAFDIQMFWFPHAIAPGDGGTGFVPGSHLRRVNEMDIARYQHVVGQRDFAGPAGSVVVFHQGMWHRGRANAAPDERWAYKIRLKPDAAAGPPLEPRDFDEVQRPATRSPVRHLLERHRCGLFRQHEPWHEMATGRLETVQRSRLWRYLTGDEAYDADWYLTRTERRELVDRRGEEPVVG